MLPIGDDNTYRLRTPFVTWFLLAANIAVFVFFQGFGLDEDVVLSYSMVPQEILTGRDVVGESRIVMDRYSGQRYEIPGLGVTPVPVYLTILISMFMHGGLAHIGGNMLFLSIFGDNVEDRLGHLRFLLFYLLSGVLARGGASRGVPPHRGCLTTPMLGASGAISASWAHTCGCSWQPGAVLLFNFIPTTVSAIVVIGMWFIFQLTNGLGYLGGVRSDGVAYAAHIGGFLYGFFGIRRWVPPRRQRVRYYYY
jgi:membrane associated rhomboid family serine protease